MSDVWIIPMVALLALAFVLWRNIRFLRQGRWYRRQNEETQAELRQADDRWDVYHGRGLSWLQILVYLLVAVAVLAFLVCRDMRLFEW